MTIFIIFYLIIIYGDLLSVYSLTHLVPIHYHYIEKSSQGLWPKFTLLYLRVERMSVWNNMTLNDRIFLFIWIIPLCLMLHSILSLEKDPSNLTDVAAKTFRERSHSGNPAMSLELQRHYAFKHFYFNSFRNAWEVPHTLFFNTTVVLQNFRRNIRDKANI